MNDHKNSDSRNTPVLLDEGFYLREEVVALAKELLGKHLVTRIDGQITSGMITETEAYAGITDRASHAFGGKRSTRTEIMFRRGGCAYIYLCYGMHSLFNIVTNLEGIPHAILVRAILPLEGAAAMCLRTGRSRLPAAAGDGPGKVSKLLGIHYSLSGLLLKPSANPLHPAIWVEYHGVHPAENQVKVTPRIGIDYAGKDAALPYRFVFLP
jgi:DNA-3-methyladenine glycosylase